MRYVFTFLMVLLFTQAAYGQGYREAFEKQFLVDVAPSERIEKSVCIECHVSEIMKPELLKIPEEWKRSWHYENNISCHDCHGGDPKDAALAMSPERGFVGTPKYAEVPEFCGKCHAGILKSYLESGHGKALKASGSGPNCVTCHGSHSIQKASIEIIEEKRCSQCHSYDRAKIMKQALFITEKKIREIDGGLKDLRHGGVYTEDLDKVLFSTHAEFRALFHTVDVSLVKARTDEFGTKLGRIESSIVNMSKELGFRKNFSAFLLLVFAGAAVVLLLLSGTYRE